VNIRAIMAISPVIPVLTVTRLDDAAPLAQAMVRGGLRVLEVTLRSPEALAVISAMRAAAPEAIVGAGTLTRAEDFPDAERAGAQFGVTPGLTAALIAAAARVSFPLLPGIMTPAELIAARAAGFTACKLFPAAQAGGITRANAAEFLSLPNVLCVGGSWLAPAALLERRDWTAIEALARDAAGLAPTSP